MSKSQSPRRVSLPDGRALGVVEGGNPTGRPVFFFSGFGLSVLCMPLEAGVEMRMIGVDRPGIGLSTPLPGRTIEGWARDIGALAEIMGIGRFAVLGWSAGGAHALACAALIDVAAVGVVCCSPSSFAGMPRKTRFLAALSRHAPWVIDWGMGIHCRQVKANPEKVIRKAFGTSDLRLREALLAGCAQGSAGLAEDIHVLAQPWRFDLANIRQTVCLWHGEQDQIVPVEVGRGLAKQLPSVSAEFFPGEGHYLYLDRWPGMIATLNQHWTD